MGAIVKHLAITVCSIIGISLFMECWTGMLLSIF